MELNWENLPTGIEVQIIESGENARFEYREYLIDKWVNMFRSASGRIYEIENDSQVKFN